MNPRCHKHKKHYALQLAQTTLFFWLSPSSQKVRVRRLMRERKALLECIEKYACTRVTLDDEQDKELQIISSTIDSYDAFRNFYGGVQAPGRPWCYVTRHMGG